MSFNYTPLRDSRTPISKLARLLDTIYDDWNDPSYFAVKMAANFLRDIEEECNALDFLRETEGKYSDIYVPETLEYLVTRFREIEEFSIVEHKGETG